MQSGGANSALVATIPHPPSGELLRLLSPGDHQYQTSGLGKTAHN
jgi:hypothetical protein